MLDPLRLIGAIKAVKLKPLEGAHGLVMHVLMANTAVLLQTLCKAMKLCQSDAERLRLVEAMRAVEPELLEGMPALEVQWVAATLWNRGVSQYKFGHPAQSVDLMRAAMHVQSWRPEDADQHQVCAMLHVMYARESTAQALLLCSAAECALCMHGCSWLRL